MATFSLLIVRFFKINRVKAVDDIDKLCKFHKNLTTDADLSCKKCKFSTENGYFSLTDCLIFFSKLIGFKLLMRWTNCVSFTYI